jgi:FixJ family two-component response regulator
MKSEPTLFMIVADPIVAESMVLLAQSHSVRSELFSSADQFLMSADPGRAGCLLIDFNLLGMNWQELHSKLLARKFHTPIILLDGIVGMNMVVQAMEEGAFTVVDKTSPQQDLWKKIEQAFAADAAAQSQYSACVDSVHRLDTLTPDETEVLNRLIDGQSNKQSAHELAIGLRTVELRRARILEKMNAGSLPELVKLVLLARNPSSWRR